MVAITAEPSKKALISRYLSSTPRAAFRLFALLTMAAMLWAWWISGNRYLQAESGVGYALGIVGGSLMLILLLYPLRKRLRFMSGWLNLKSWFQLHMLLGVLGPLCILLHSNFRLGSTNSTVALVCMLLVAGSGLVGRYLYGKFHFGLYGQQVGLQQIKTDLDPDLLNITGSSVHLGKSIYNLISNAIKYTPAGGDVHLILRGHDAGETPTVKLMVEDNGLGIEPEHLQYIFDRYYRVPDSHQSTKPTSGGFTLMRLLSLLQRIS